jgi:hypothetical protein
VNGDEANETVLDDDADGDADPDADNDIDEIVHDTNSPITPTLSPPTARSKHIPQTQAQPQTRAQPSNPYPVVPKKDSLLRSSHPSQSHLTHPPSRSQNHTPVGRPRRDSDDVEDVLFEAVDAAEKSASGSATSGHSTPGAESGESQSHQAERKDSGATARVAKGAKGRMRDGEENGVGGHEKNGNGKNVGRDDPEEWLMEVAGA